MTKQTWGAFTNTDLEARLKGLGVTQLALAGVAIQLRRGVDRPATPMNWGSTSPWRSTP
ncbi:MAG: hypothetical protein WDM85_05495 [Caulobacteraceae bacterium]